MEHVTKQDICNLPTDLQNIIYRYKEQLDRTPVLIDAMACAISRKVNIVSKLVDKVDGIRIQMQEDDGGLTYEIIDRLDSALILLTKYIKDRDDTYESGQKSIYDIIRQI